MKPASAFVIAVFVLLAAYPLVGGQYGIDLVAKIMVYAIFALSLELLVGGTGLVCFGQAAFFGIGAYAAVRLSPDGSRAAFRHVKEMFVQLLALDEDRHFQWIPADGEA